MVDNTDHLEHNSDSGSGNQDRLDQPAHFVYNVSETWLRVYPLPQQEKESICSTVFRCVACQLGLASILLLWTALWVFVINAFEGPYEVEVAENFETEQNQLVIDLATELRQITPISSKWKEAIQRRIQEEKHLTIHAVGKGARLHPGHFWDLPGTFLFTIYVMTALGFGAPVPHTVWGRSSAFFYAFIAVPTHIYLMVNASTCFVANCCTSHRWRKPCVEDRSATNNAKESSNLNPDELKTSKCNSIRTKIMRCLCIVGAYHGLPVAVLSYYALGAISFGVLRDRTSLDILMFPLEFTTTGGLESVASYIRILYGLYVEGAMALLAWVLATLRRRNNNALYAAALKYRLFHEV